MYVYVCVYIYIYIYHNGVVEHGYIMLYPSWLTMVDISK